MFWVTQKNKQPVPIANRGEQASRAEHTQRFLLKKWSRGRVKKMSQLKWISLKNSFFTRLNNHFCASFYTKKGYS